MGELIGKTPRIRRLKSYRKSRPLPNTLFACKGEGGRKTDPTRFCHDHVGWTFGDEKSPQWKESLPGGKKFQFQNPLHQSYKSMKALQEFLGIEEEKIFSVVMFWGEAEFKTPMPPNLMTHGYVPYIKSKCDVLFTGEEMDDTILAIKTGMLPKTWVTGRQHVADLKTRFASTTTCPKCGSNLALRTTKSGEGAGSQFYGCSGFPRCRYVKKLEI